MPRAAFGKVDSRTIGWIAGLAVVAAGFAAQRAAAQAAPTPVPVAPAGGIDPAKLPDVQGIHLGMAPQDVQARFKTLYPNVNSHLGTTPYSAKIDGGSDPAWLARIAGSGTLCSDGISGCDNMQVQFSEPPNQQRVVAMERGLQFTRGHEPTPDKVKAALLQKYGANPIVLGPYLLSWLYDEQGQPAVLAPAVAKRRTQCAGDYMATKVDPNINGAQPLTQADINTLMVNPCRVGVVVYAQITVSGQIAVNMDVTVSENSEDTRDYIAATQYLAAQSAALKQKQMKNAQQVAAPPM